MCSGFQLKRLVGVAGATFIGWCARSDREKIWHRLVDEIAVSAH